MGDNLQRSFESMSMGRAQNGQQAGNALPMRSSTGSLNSSSSFANAYSGGTGAHNLGINGNGPNDPQSASARFERIFNPHSAGPSSLATDAFNGSSSPYKQHQALPYDAAPNQMPNGGAFGAYGPPFQSHLSSMGQHGMNMPNIFGGNAGMPLPQPKMNNVRQGLPQQWGSSSEDAPFANSSPTHGFISPQASFFGAPQGSAGFIQGGSPGAHGANLQLADDDVIPTAIVVKNIPFSIKREQLLQIIEELHIPMPYAFNYHFDQGVFRGLAFANFRSGEEADAVVAALNGFDVAGRKLRVEYKKVLQAGEKERIEKEKAIKRMQSMQMEKERMRRQTVSTGLGEDWASHFGPMGPPAPPPAIASMHHGGSGKPPGLDLDVGGYGSVSGASEGSRAESYAGLHSDGSRGMPDLHADLAADAASELAGRREDLDLNDPATLEIYSRVLLFKDDRMRDELSFSRNLSSAERRIVEMVSRRLNLYHYTSGEGEDRFVTVTKTEVSTPHRPLRNSASIIGRNHRGDSNASSSNGLLGGTNHGSQAARNSLRMKKSAPDMKRPRDRSEEAASYANMYAMGLQGHNSNALPNGYNHSSNSYQAGNNLSRKSNGNLREGFASSMTRRSNPTIGTAGGLHGLFNSGMPFDVPPVPALPTHPMTDSASLLRAAHTPSPTPIGAERTTSATSGAIANGGSNTHGPGGHSQHVLRQPAGPGAAQSNFAQRNRGPVAALEGFADYGPSHRQSPDEGSLASDIARSTTGNDAPRTQETLEV